MARLRALTCALNANVWVSAAGQKGPGVGSSTATSLPWTMDGMPPPKPPYC